MVARSGVVFMASMADILANLMDICFSSFTATSTALAATTSGDHCEDFGDTRRHPHFRSGVEDPPAQTL
jgi:hypothetical protein